MQNTRYSQLMAGRCVDVAGRCPVDVTTVLLARTWRKGGRSHQKRGQFSMRDE